MSEVEFLEAFQENDLPKARSIYSYFKNRSNEDRLVKFAIDSRKMDLVKWLVVDQKTRPSGKIVAYSIDQPEFLKFFVEHKGVVDLDLIFEEYGKKVSVTKIETDVLHLNGDSVKHSDRFVCSDFVQIAVSLAKTTKQKLKIGHITPMVHELENLIKPLYVNNYRLSVELIESDINRILQDVETNGLAKKTKITLIVTGYLDKFFPDLSNEKMTLSDIRDCFTHGGDPFIFKNVLNRLKKNGFDPSNQDGITFPFYFMFYGINTHQTIDIINELALEDKTIISWIGQLMEMPQTNVNLSLIETLVGKISQGFDQFGLFSLGLLARDDTVPLVESLFEKFNIPKISWVEFVKLSGLEVSKLVKNALTDNLKNFIDFSEPDGPEEVWVWYGVGNLYGSWSTYVRVDYDKATKVEIDPRFENIKTLKDLDLDELNQTFESPTSCYFQISGEIFFHDQQDCILWALDRVGRVYIYDEDSPYLVKYCSKSLPEFLTRINVENKMWYSQFIGQTTDQ